jgi:hypothetical protein
VFAADYRHPRAQRFYDGYRRAAFGVAVCGAHARGQDDVGVFEQFEVSGDGLHTVEYGLSPRAGIGQDFFRCLAVCAVAEQVQFEVDIV